MLSCDLNISLRLTGARIAKTTPSSHYNAMPTRRSLHDLSALSTDAAEIAAALQPRYRRIVLFGPMGIGKSSLAAQLGTALAQQQQDCWCLSADPGTPAFGVPGAVSLAKWVKESWEVRAVAALCTLDAGRFRLPLVSAVRSLAQHLPDCLVLLDTPGVVRGVAGKELLDALVNAVAADAVLALTTETQPPPLLDELCALPTDIFVIRTPGKTARPGKRARARQRTAQWDAYLAGAHEQHYDLVTLHVTGNPPPREVPHTWVGRQIALLRANQTLALGEVVRLVDSDLLIRVTGEVQQADTLLLRDATRNPDGFLETAEPFAVEPYTYLPPADVVPAIEISTGPRLVGRVGMLDVGLINGVYGDPLLHLRLRHQRRSLLFDLGEAVRLPARIAHQVSDAFLSHAHFDHIGGFTWLLRSRLGDYPVCRLYGPPGLAQHIQGFLQGVLWDRIADRGPAFEVMEFHGSRLQCFRLQAGYAQLQALDDIVVENDVLVHEAGFRIRGILLDHHGTEVMAYAFQPDKQINIRKDRLRARGLTPGPWLNALKQHLLTEDTAALIQLPDGSEVTAGSLAEELVIITPGKKLVYATDLADTPANRQSLIQLARHAHTFFCEAPFLEADADHALRNGHLTTRACGEIAHEAMVARLVPFHFSRRYLDTPALLYEEIARYCPRVLTPTTLGVHPNAMATESETAITLGD